MNKLTALILFFILSLSVSCINNSPPNKYALIATGFFKVYEQKKDFEKFMSFYAEEAVLLDMINGDSINDKENINRFFDWNNPAIENNEEVNLVVLEQIAEGKSVVAKGYFKPFKWQGRTVEAMHFTTILEFNEAGLIVRQEDWINYPSTLIDYNARRNSNEWIHE